MIPLRIVKDLQVDIDSKWRRSTNLRNNFPTTMAGQKARESDAFLETTHNRPMLIDQIEFGRIESSLLTIRVKGVILASS